MNEKFQIGICTYFTRPSFRLYSSRMTNMDDIVKSYDRKLHESLDKIIREDYFSSSSSSQFEETDLKSKVRPILEQESILSEHFSKEELEKLSLLWISVLACYEQSAELLVISGADVSEPFGRRNPQVIDEKWTVLRLLLDMNPSPENERLVRLVMDQGVDLKALDHKGQTVLHQAVRQGRVQLAKTLLGKGADVNLADYNGDTPLLIAASHEKAVELVPLLMKNGADIFAKNRNGDNVLHRLALIMNPFMRNIPVELARVFIKRGVPLEGELVAKSLGQPLHLAAFSGNNELVKLYLEHGANVNALRNNQESPVYVATFYDRPKVLETLIQHGAKVDQRASNGRTPLHLACQFASRSNRMESVISVLVSAGADVLAEDSSGETPLGHILSTGNAERPGIQPILKMLALKKAIQPSIELKDERIIEQYQVLQDYYRECFQVINKMKITRFTYNCTLFELFAKSQCQIVRLMRNPKFETEFEQCDLNDGFYSYANDIRRAFQRAKDLCHRMDEMENVIVEAVYNILPDLIIRKVINYVFNE